MKIFRLHGTPSFEYRYVFPEIRLQGSNPRSCPPRASFDLRCQGFMKIDRIYHGHTAPEFEAFLRSRERAKPFYQRLNLWVPRSLRHAS